MKADGYNTVQVYFDWAFHSAKQGVYDFTGVRDIERFLTIAEGVGLYVIARPGPYINAETDAGGFPGWTLTEKGMARTSDADFTTASAPSVTAAPVPPTGTSLPTTTVATSPTSPVPTIAAAAPAASPVPTIATAKPAMTSVVATTTAVPTATSVSAMATSTGTPSTAFLPAAPSPSITGTPSTAFLPALALATPIVPARTPRPATS